MEFECSLHVSVDFLQILHLLPTVHRVSGVREIGESKLLVGVNVSAR